MTVFDALVEIIERRRIYGAQFISLSKDNREFLWGNATGGQLSSRQGRPRASTNEAPVKASAAPASSRARIETNSAKSFPAQEKSTEKSPPAPDISANVSFDELRELVRVCERCSLCHSRRHAVFGEGNKHAELMFVGDGPDEEDDRQGRPFVDAAGVLLDKIIQAMGYDRSKVYVTYVTRCRPQTKRPPAAEEAHACLPYLRREIELINPKVIVLLGAIPLNHLLNVSSISKYRGRWLTYKGIDCMPTYHPSYLLRKPSAKRDVWKDMQLVMQKLAAK